LIFFVLFCFVLFCFYCFGDRVSPCSPGWLWTFNPSASVSCVLGTQVCTTTPGQECAFIFVVLASHLLGRHSTTWATLPALFTLVIFQVGSYVFCPGQPGPWPS
jgi:hypothetical protein